MNFSVHDFSKIVGHDNSNDCQPMFDIVLEMWLRSLHTDIRRVENEESHVKYVCVFDEKMEDVDVEFSKFNKKDKEMWAIAENVTTSEKMLESLKDFIQKSDLESLKVKTKVFLIDNNLTLTKSMEKFYGV